MTLEDAVSRLEELGPPRLSDAEQDHATAEAVLCAFLRANGAAVLADAFESCRERVGFWYA